MSDQVKQTQTEILLGALVKEVSRMASAMEAIASVQAPAPNITRPMGDWANAREILENLGATVTAEDRSGPTRCDYQGRVYVRRSAHDEDMEKSDAIWFSCVVSGSVKNSDVKWARLVTFRDRKTDTLPNGAKKLKVDAPNKKAQKQEAAKQPATDAQSQKLTAPTSGGNGKATSATQPDPASPRWPLAAYHALTSVRLGNTERMTRLLESSKFLTPKTTEVIFRKWAMACAKAVFVEKQDDASAVFLADSALGGPAAEAVKAK